MATKKTPQATSPLPWRVGISQCDDVYAGEKHYAILDGDGNIVADMEHGLAPLAKANAERLAAVDEILAALDYLLEQTVDMDLAYGIGLTEGEAEARARALALFERINGNAT